MRKTDEDALSLWLKYYPEKARGTYLALHDALNRTASTAAEMGEAMRKMSANISAAAHSAATQTTDSLTEAYDKKIKAAQEKPVKVAEPAPAQEYNLTEVKSDMKFDWEEPKFTSMTDIEAY